MLVPNQSAAFFVFHRHSLFIPLKYVYPECSTLIEPHDQLYPLFCLRNDSCPANRSCMDVLAKRINYLFTQVAPEAQQILAYYKYRDRPNSIRAGVFSRSLDDPRVMTLNRSAFLKFQKEGVAFTWVPPADYIVTSLPTNLIPVQNLLVKPDDR